MKWRWLRTAEEMAADFAATRSPVDDECFVSACGLPDTQLARQVALAVRNSVAQYGMIDPKFILADDVYPDQLVNLSGWDSPDIVDWIMELEKELSCTLTDDEWLQLVGDLFAIRDLVQNLFLCVAQRET